MCSESTYTCIQVCVYMHACKRYAFKAYLKDGVLQEVDMLCMYRTDVVSRMYGMKGK
jgi:hypothetical protein